MKNNFNSKVGTLDVINQAEIKIFKKKHPKSKLVAKPSKIRGKVNVAWVAKNGECIEVLYGFLRSEVKGKR